MAIAGVLDHGPRAMGTVRVRMIVANDATVPVKEGLMAEGMTLQMMKMEIWVENRKNL